MSFPRWLWERGGRSVAWGLAVIAVALLVILVIRPLGLSDAVESGIGGIIGFVVVDKLRSDRA